MRTLKLCIALADAEWSLRVPEVPESLTITVFAVAGETNTDDLSPVRRCMEPSDIPPHALVCKRMRCGIGTGRRWQTGPRNLIEDLRQRQ